MPHPPRVSTAAHSSIHPEQSLKSSLALSLSVGGSASLTGNIEAHIIPRVEFGVSLLLGAAQASIYLEVDGYGVLDINLAGSIVAPTTSTASTSTSTSVPGATTSGETSTSESTRTCTSNSTSNSSTTISTTGGPASKSTSAYTYGATATQAVVDTAKTQLGHNPHKRMLVSGAGSKRDNSSYIYEGCVGLDVGVSVNAGAQGQLFNLWSGDINWDIYSQKWDVFEVSCFLTYLSDGLLQYITQKCFGTPARRRSEPKLHWARFDLRSNQLTCPSILNEISLI